MIALGALISIVVAAVLMLQAPGHPVPAESAGTDMSPRSTSATTAQPSAMLVDSGAHAGTNAEPDANRQPEEVESLVTQLEELEQCAKGVVDCALPQADPRSAELELALRLARTIDELTQLSQAGVGDPQAYDPIAQRYVQHSDGHVQEAALELMATLPPHPQQVTALLAGLQNTHDAGIYRMALLEFERHPEPTIRRRIDAFLMETLRTGGHFASQEVASRLLPLLDENNIDAYRELAAELPQDTRKGQDLRLAIERFEHSRHSG